MSNVKLFSGSQRQKIELRLPIDAAEIAGQSSIPTIVYQGVGTGLSLPIWDSNQEQIFGSMHVPKRWDGESDFTVHLSCYLASAEDDHAFKFQLSWEHYGETAATVPTTSNDVEVETETGGTASQFKPFGVEFTIDYDIDGGGSEITADECFKIRLRRIDKTGGKTECSGEIVVTHIGVIFQINKYGDNV